MLFKNTIIYYVFNDFPLFVCLHIGSNLTSWIQLDGWCCWLAQLDGFLWLQIGSSIRAKREQILYHLQMF